MGKAQIYYIVETLLRVHRFANLGVSGCFLSPRWLRTHTLQGRYYSLSASQDVRIAR